MEVQQRMCLNQLWKGVANKFRKSILKWVDTCINLLESEIENDFL
jgi:hypothetical protein